MSKGGSAPQPVDPYAQAAAQYGLSTGTAEFNAGLNRTNTVNPMGSSIWSVNGQPTAQAPGGPFVEPGNEAAGNRFGLGGTAYPSSIPNTATASQGMPYGLGGDTFNAPTGAQSANFTSANTEYGS